jgi:hypothetical protein
MGAWQGLGDEPIVPPISRDPSLSQAEVEAEFWEKIGYPSPESRTWERAASPEVRSLFCGSEMRARSTSPSRLREDGLAHRASSTSPVGLWLSKPPRMGKWRGPLPPRRITPTPVLGDFLVKAVASKVCWG